VARLTLTGLFFNLFFLGSAGGDAARFAGTLGHAADRKAKLALSLIQDRLVGLGALLLVLAGFIGMQGPRLWGEPSVRPLAIGVPVACAAFAAAVSALWFLAYPTDAVIGDNSRHWRALSLEAIRVLLPKPVFMRALAFSLTIQVLVIAAAFLAAWAVGIGISFPAAAVVLGVTALALSLPVTVARLGVRDGMLLWLLAAFGFKSPAAPISLSACLLGICLCWAFVGGIAFYWTTQTDSRKR
jgi:hypothetical protein